MQSGFLSLPDRVVLTVLSENWNRAEAPRVPLTDLRIAGGLIPASTSAVGADLWWLLENCPVEPSTGLVPLPLHASPRAREKVHGSFY